MRRGEEDRLPDFRCGGWIEHPWGSRFPGEIRPDDEPSHAVRHYIHLGRRQAIQERRQVRAQLFDGTFRALRAVLEEVNIRHIVGRGREVSLQVAESAGGIGCDGAGTVYRQLQSVEQHHGEDRRSGVGLHDRRHGEVNRGRALLPARIAELYGDVVLTGFGGQRNCQHDATALQFRCDGKAPIDGQGGTRLGGPHEGDRLGWSIECDAAAGSDCESRLGDGERAMRLGE